MKRFLPLLFFSLFFLGCRNTAVDYISFNGKDFISVIQSHKAFQKEEPAIYIVKGKSENKIPSNNFVKAKYCDYSAYYSVQNDTTILIMPGWDFDVASVKDRKFIVLKDFTESDKIRYDYDDRQKFYENIKTKYVSFDRFKLKKDW